MPLLLRKASPAPGSDKPVIPADIKELYLEGGSADATYLPRVLGIARLHFVDKAAGLDVWETRSLIAPLDDNGSNVDWSQADVGADLQKQLSTEAPENARYAEAPAALLRAQNYRSWQKELVSHLYSNSTLPIFHCPKRWAICRSRY